MKELTSKKTWPKSQLFNCYKLLCVNVCWQEKSRETELVYPCQSELQSLLHMMKLEEGRVELFLPRSRFCSASWWRLMSAFSNPSFTVRLHRARSRAASSQLFGSISHALRSRFHASFNCIAGSSTFLTPVGNWPYRTSWEMRPLSMPWTCLSHLRRRLLCREYKLGVLARDSISLLVMWFCHLTQRMRLRHRRWKEFKGCFCLM